MSIRAQSVGIDISVAKILRYPSIARVAGVLEDQKSDAIGMPPGDATGARQTSVFSLAPSQRRMMDIAAPGVTHRPHWRVLKFDLVFIANVSLMPFRN
jgi:hypothetical protein